jgi:hypothetical protein
MTAASLVLAALLAAPAGAGPAPLSEPATATARLEVRAAPDCTTRDDLISRVAARSPRIRFVEDASALAIRAVFTVGHNVVGELILAGPSGMPSSRRLVTRSCAEAADAMALIIAVTLDPSSALDVPAAGADNGTGTAASAPLAGATPAGPSLARGARGEPARAAAGAPSAIASASAPPVTSRRRFGAQLAGQLVWGPAPAVMPGLAAYAVFGIDRDALWSPALLLGFAHAQRTGLAEQGGTADFALDVITLDGCPVRTRQSVIEARTCVAGLLGRLAARGTETYLGATASRPFAAIGASGVVGVRLGSRFELVARVGAGYPLIRDSFEFAPDTFHRVAPVTLAGSLGLELHEP